MQPQTCLVGNPGAYLTGVPLSLPPMPDVSANCHQPGASTREIEHVVERIEQLGLRSHLIVGTERTVIAALGEKRDGAKQALETGEGVEKVVPILAPFKMASTEVKKDRTVVTAFGLE